MTDPSPATRGVRPLRDPLKRLVYRVGYHLLHAYWLVLRPRKRGAKCVLTRGDRVLLVRHTYGRDEWDLPGGGVRRREAPADAARREMREELGIDITEWTYLGDLFARIDSKRDTLCCFAADIDGLALDVDRGEIEDARWFGRDELPRPLSKYVRRILTLSDRAKAR